MELELDTPSSTRLGWELWAALAGLAFVLLYIGAFALGIDAVGTSNKDIVAYYSDSANRVKQLAAFFLIAGAALSFLVFAGCLRGRIAAVEKRPRTLAAFAWAGGTLSAALMLVGDATSRAAALAAFDESFRLDPNTWRLADEIGSLLFVAATLAAIVLVIAVSLGTLWYGLLPRWLGWAGFPIAALMTLAIAFVGFLALALWVLAASVALALRATTSAGDHRENEARSKPAVRLET